MMSFFPRTGLVTTILTGVVGLGLSACGIIPGTANERIPPGYVGLKVELYGKNRGVQNATISTGKVWYNSYTEDVIIFPDHVQYYILTAAKDEGSPIDESITFGVGGTSVNADVSLTYFFNTDKIKLFYGKYLKDPDEFKSTLVRSETRNCFNTAATGLKPEDIVGSKQSQLLKDVQHCLNQKFGDVGVTFESIGFVSKPRFAQEIEAQITLRFQAEQQAIAAKAQLEVAKAEAERKVAEAKGDAEVARIQQQSATAASIRLRELDLQEKAIEKWNGVLPLYQGGSAPIPLFDAQTNLPAQPQAQQ